MIDRPQIPPVPETVVPIGNGRETECETMSFAAWLARVPAPSQRDLPGHMEVGGVPEALPDVAKIFNQDGFFSHSPDMVGTDGAPLPADRFAPLPQQKQSLDPHATGDLPRLPTNEGADGLTPIGGNIASTPATLAITQRTRQALTPQGDALGGPVATAQTSSSVAVETAELLETPVIPKRLLYPFAQARSALHIAMRDLDRGLQILVAAHSLSAEERERLAGEIAGMLSRHGLVLTDVRILSTAQRQARKDG